MLVRVVSTSVSIFIQPIFNSVNRFNSVLNNDLFGIIRKEWRKNLYTETYHNILFTLKQKFLQSVSSLSRLFYSPILYSLQSVNYNYTTIYPPVFILINTLANHSTSARILGILSCVL